MPFRSGSLFSFFLENWLLDSEMQNNLELGLMVHLIRVFSLSSTIGAIW